MRVRRRRPATAHRPRPSTPAAPPRRAARGVPVCGRHLDRRRPLPRLDPAPPRHPPGRTACGAPPLPGAGRAAHRRDLGGRDGPGLRRRRARQPVLAHAPGRPARTITDTPGVRIRLPEMLGVGGQVAYITDADGEDAVEIAYLPRASGDRAPRRMASGELGCVLEMVADPQGERLAIASNDGRLLLLTVGTRPGKPRRPRRPTSRPVRSPSWSARSTGPCGTCVLTGRPLAHLVASGDRPVAAPDQDGPDQGPADRRCHQRPIRGREPGVHPGRALSGLPVLARVRPGVRRAPGDLSFPLGCRPYLVPLSSATPSPSR